MHTPIVALSAALALGAAAPAAADLPASGTLDLASTGADLSYLGEVGSRAGFATAPVGDVNGDGIPDVAVGAPEADPQQRTNAGSVHVVFGRAPGGAERVLLGDLGSRGFRIDGASRGDQVGFAVAPAGDVNGDGLADLLLGAPEASTADRAEAGVVSVVLGRATTTPVDLAAPDAAWGRVIGAAAGDHLGVALDAVPDVDGDGRGDLLLGAPNATIGGKADGGSAFLVPATPGDRDLGAADAAKGVARFDGAPSRLAGLSVAHAGDLDADGRPDVVVGAPATDPDATTEQAAVGRGDGKSYAGAAYVVLNPTVGTRTDLTSLPAGGGFRIRGRGGEGLGLSVAAVGDVSGDGKGDLAIGAPLADRNGRKDSGSAYVLWDVPAGTQDLDIEAAPGARRFDGVAAGDALGSGVSAAGDFEGDGVGDVVLSSVFADPVDRRDAGTAHVLRGPVTAATPLDLSKLDPRDGVALQGSTPGGGLRQATGGADVTGDGLPDVIAGEVLGADTSGAETQPGGAIRIVRGTRPMPPVTPLPPDPGKAEEVKLDKCRAVTTFELLIDDSGSMEDADPDRLRAKAVQLLLEKPSNEGRTFGAVSFGSEAELLFPSQVLTPGDDRQRQDLGAILERGLQAEGGGTNYNAGFRDLDRLKGSADARIFLTDGEHNEGELRNLHRGGPPTYVVGLGIGVRGAGRRLARIARETKGRYFPAVTRATLQGVMNAIDSKVNCDVDLDTFQDTLLPADPQADQNLSTIQDGVHSVDLNISWDDPAADVQPDDLVVRQDDGSLVTITDDVLRQAAVGDAPVQVGAFTVAGRRGATYISLRINGLGASKRLAVTVKATDLKGRAKVRTQVGKSRRRR